MGENPELHWLFPKIPLTPRFLAPKVTCVINCELKTKGQNTVPLSPLILTGENRDSGALDETRRSYRNPETQRLSLIPVTSSFPFKRSMIPLTIYKLLAPPQVESYEINT